MSDDEFDEAAYREYENELYCADSSEGDSGVDSDIANAVYSEVHYAAELDIPLTPPACDTVDDPILPSNEPEFVKSVDGSSSESDKYARSKKDELCGRVGMSSIYIASDQCSDSSCLEEDFQGESFFVVDDADDSNTGMSTPNSELSDGEIHSESLNSVESASKEENWALDEKDLKKEKTAKTVSRYYCQTSAKLKIRCFNCNERGHTKSECPIPKKADVCILCGLIGHLNWKCPNDLCFNCYEPGHQSKACRKPRKRPHASCHRCLMNGHLERECPDLWRRFHQTTRPGGVVKPSLASKPTGPVYCYNCSKKGHYGHECPEDRMQDRTIPPLPFIITYSDRFESRKRKQRRETNECNRFDRLDKHYRRHTSPTCRGSHRAYNDDMRPIGNERIVQVISPGNKYGDRTRDKFSHEQKASRTLGRDQRDKLDVRDRKSNCDSHNSEFSSDRMRRVQGLKSKKKRKKKKKKNLDTAPDELRKGRNDQFDGGWCDRGAAAEDSHERKRRRDVRHVSGGEDSFKRVRHNDDFGSSQSRRSDAGKPNFISDRGFRFRSGNKTDYRHKQKHRKKYFTH